jgi:hypothetical protein
MRGIPSIFKPGWLLHIHIFREETMKKSIANINLTESPPSRHCKGNNQMNCGRLDNRAESLTIINTMLLSKTTSHQTSFVLINGTIRLVLCFEHPLAANNIDPGRTRNKNPSVILTKGRELIGHSGTPGRFRKSITVGRGSSKKSTTAWIIAHSAIGVDFVTASIITMTRDHTMTGGISRRRHGWRGTSRR